MSVGSGASLRARLPKVIAKAAIALARKLWIMAAAGGLMLMALGARELSLLQSAHEPVQVSLHDLEHGAPPNGIWMEITGQPSRLHATDYGVTPNQTYVPVTSFGWRGPAVSMVLKFPADTKLPEHTFRGLEVTESVPTPISQIWLESGVDARSATVLELGAKPESRRPHMIWMFGLGTGLLLVAAGIFRASRTARQTERTNS